MGPKRAAHISRSGLLRCPGCNAHNQVLNAVASRCVFCSTALGGPVGAAGALHRALRGGRGKVIAASLLGFATFGGCPSGPEGPTVGAGDAITETVVPEDGDVSADDAIGPLIDGVTGHDLAPDGIPEDVVAVPDDAVLSETAVADAAEQDLLTGGDQVDALSDAVAEISSDDSPETSNDIATDDGESDSPDAADTAVEDAPVPVPLYGIPPGNGGGQ